MDTQELVKHILRMYETHELEEALIEAFEKREAQQAARIDALREIFTDPVNQLEVTKRGYYIYRFDLETMHRIADALGVIAKPDNHPLPVLAAYTPEELTRLIGD